MINLNDAVSLETVDTLKKYYLTFFGVKPKNPRKATLTEALTQSLSDPVQLETYWQKLSELEQALIQECVFNYSGFVDRSRFTVKYKNFPQSIRQDRYFSSRDRLTDPISIFFYPDAERYATHRIPNALSTLLKQFIGKPVIDQLKTTALPDVLSEHQRLVERERSALSELHSILILLQNKQIKVSEKTGVASTATLKKIAKDIHEYYEETSSGDADGMEYIATYGWLRLIGNSQLTKQSKSTLIPAKKADINPADTIKAIWNQWLNNRSEDEFRRINHIKGQTGKGKRFFTDVVGRRQAIVGALKQCPVNTWVSFEALSEFMFITGAKFKVTSAPEYLYILDANYGGLYDAGWETFEASYLRCFLLEYAATLGLIDIVITNPEKNDEADEEYLWGTDGMDCLTRYDGIQLIRLTPLGQYVLALTHQYQPEETVVNETPLTVHRQGRMVFDRHPTPWEQQFLSLYAEQDKDTVWKLSRRKIMETQQIGGSIDELKQFLLARETQPFLPEDCEGLLNQAKANLDGVKIQTEALIITCKNKEIAELISNDKTLSKWCQRLDNTKVVIPGNKEQKFRELLNTMGIGCS